LAPYHSTGHTQAIAAGRTSAWSVIVACAFTFAALCAQATTTRTAAVAGAPSSLERDFLDPPASARPRVWWHWMGPNVSTAGITKDLEAMKASGIAGATIFNLTSAVQESHAPTANNPWPDQIYRSPAYWEAVRHAAAEADRLGLEIGLHNTVGYSTTGGPWIDEPRSMQRLVWSQAEIDGTRDATLTLAVPTVPPYQGWGKTGRELTYFRDIAVLAVPSGPAELAVADVLDLSSAMTASGELRWRARPGRWTVYRLGHASTGASPHPVPDEVLGKTLEADKMSLQQTRFHWTTVLDPLRAQVGPWIGRSFTHVLVDSYEAGGQNWTPGFREEFTRRKGYDPLPWLVTLGPTVAGDARAAPARTIGSADLTARFDWDYRDVIAALYQERGWEPAAQLVHAAGLRLEFEPYTGPFDTVAATGVADVPMVEFWTHTIGGDASSVVSAARAAGRRVVAAEAFTSAPQNSRWTETPAFLKPSGDAAFAAGVNRMVLHHWVHQPFDDRYRPGMGMGWWGTHFGRHQTWAGPAREFFRYLARVQALLQRGETPVDILSVGFNGAADADSIPPRVLLDDLRVVDGRLVLPSGRTYAVLHVPHEGALEPVVVRRLASLLAQGATVVSIRPDRSPSLAGYPQCDTDVRSLGEKLWGVAGRSRNRQVGAGRLFTDLDEARRAVGWSPIARIDSGGSDKIRIHARQDGTASVFFVANLDARPARLTASFRVKNLQPELWDAESGSITNAPVWRATGERTAVDLSLGAEKTVFVVFRDPAPAQPAHVTSVDAPCDWSLTTDATGRPVIRATTACSGQATLASGARVVFDLTAPTSTEVRGPWTVGLQPAAGAPTQLTLARLSSLSEQPDPAVRYFSGTATYRTRVRLDAAALSGGARVFLDLGAVRDLVHVAVNDRDFGVLWHPPFVRDVTAALQPGDNTLTLAVTNTWHNRLVGDEQYPPDVAWGDARTFQGRDVGRPLKAYPEWFLAQAPRPSADRLTFVTWAYHTRDTPLFPSGLVGPVRLLTHVDTAVAP
jgi:hypothetical protein